MKKILVAACLLTGHTMTLEAQKPLAGAAQRLAVSNPTEPPTAEACDYDRCSLRFTLGFGSWSVVQGIDNKKVGRLGMFRGPSVEKLVEAVPEAADEARRFRRGYATSSAFLWGGAAITVLGSALAAGNDGNPIAVGLTLSGLGMMTYGAWSHGKSFNSLSRSLWLYNRSLKR